VREEDACEGGAARQWFFHGRGQRPDSLSVLMLPSASHRQDTTHGPEGGPGLGWGCEPRSCSFAALRSNAHRPPDRVHVSGKAWRDRTKATCVGRFDHVISTQFSDPCSLCS